MHLINLLALCRLEPEDYIVVFHVIVAMFTLPILFRCLQTHIYIVSHVYSLHLSNYIASVPHKHSCMYTHIYIRNTRLPFKVIRSGPVICY
uniref:Uncharacterized protein n=1 Tax=Oryza rufipogon TaxID=4529 RepID=A0A0E0P669_ORYRU